MNKEILASNLLKAIETCDAVNGDHVLVRKSDAIEILRILTGNREIRSIPKNTEGQTLFYCADCSRSFWADGREDRECFEKYQYHTWYSVCPWCKREVSQNDRYWR